MKFSEKKKESLGTRLKKKFSRPKKRSLSADRASSSVREGSNYLQPPEGSVSPRSKGLLIGHVVALCLI